MRVYVPTTLVGLQTLRANGLGDPVDPYAVTGDHEAQLVVDGAAGHELLWYDVTELDDVLDLP